MLLVREITCTTCLMTATLPETTPTGEEPRCALCGNLLLAYAHCVSCDLSYHPDHQACPHCGKAPSGNLPDLLPDDIVLEALRALRAATAPPADAPPPEPTPARQATSSTRQPAQPSTATPTKRGGSTTQRARDKAEQGPGTALPSVAPTKGGEEPALPPALRTVEANPEVSAAPAAMFADNAGSVEAGVSLEVNYELIGDSARLAEVVAELAGARVVAVDTETTGLDPFVENTLLLVQVATPERAYLVDARKVDSRPLRRILEDERILKLLQNAKFDYKMLRQQLGIRMRNMYDTMLAERVLTAGISREIGLASLTKKYTGLPMDKAIRSSFIDSNGEFSHAQLRYAARDALVLFTIYEQQRVALQKERLLKVAKLEFDTVVAVSEMELAGCLIDQQRWRTIIDASKEERDRAATELGDMLTAAGAVPQLTLFGGPAINLNSNAQLLEAFRLMGIDLPDTMEATLDKVKKQHPVIEKLLEYRSHEKTISAFGEKFLELINKRTGRIHPDFNQLGADTGRFSCTNPNVQQIPATSDFRSCFVATPGYKLITCDYSQAELRILAQLSEDPAFVEAFCSGGDLHQLTASQMYQVPPDQVTKQMRSAAKVINFGLAYGRGPAALGGQLGVSTEEAKGLIDQYFRAYASIGKWLDRAGRDAVRKGFSITMLGRKRYYPPLDPDDVEYNKKRSSIERQGKNSPIQGANADMTKLALIGLTEALQDYDARVVNTVHDEIVVEAREDQAEVVCKLVEREMINAGQQIVKLVPIVADAKIADYWSK